MTYLSLLTGWGEGDREFLSLDLFCTPLVPGCGEICPFVGNDLFWTPLLSDCLLSLGGEWWPFGLMPLLAKILDTIPVKQVPSTLLSLWFKREPLNSKPIESIFSPSCIILIASSSFLGALSSSTEGSPPPLFLLSAKTRPTTTGLISSSLPLP